MADRHVFRAKWHDYDNGVYFVTICCHNMHPYFGRVYHAEMCLSEIGRILLSRIEISDSLHAGCFILHWVIMPNHLHLIVGVRKDYSLYTPEEAAKHGCLKGPGHDGPGNPLHHNSLLSSFIGRLKGMVTKQCREKGLVFKWQPRFYETIVRNDHQYEAIVQYMDNNPRKWQSDEYYTE